jgi:hypothetical protein
MAHHTSHFSPQARHPNEPLSATTVRPIGAKTASDADIAKRAYEKYEARGRADGFDQEDWAAASRELVAESFGHLSLSRSPSPGKHVS